MRPTFDIIAYLVANFNHTNVSGSTIEDLSADPSIMDEDEFLNTQATHNTNGYIVFNSESEASSIEMDVLRHVIHTLGGYILYDSKTKKDDATINRIKKEMRSVLNVNNVTKNRSWIWLINPPTEYNHNPQNGKIDFIIQASKLFERADQ